MARAIRQARQETSAEKQETMDRRRLENKRKDYAGAFTGLPFVVRDAPKPVRSFRSRDSIGAGPPGAGMANFSSAAWRISCVGEVFYAYASAFFFAVF